MGPRSGVRAGDRMGDRVRDEGTRLRATMAKRHSLDSGASTSLPSPVGALPSAPSSPSPAGGAQLTSYPGRPPAHTPSPSTAPHSPCSGAALSEMRKQCILLKFRDSRRTHAGGRTMVRKRPNVHSGASAAEQTEWACRWENGPAVSHSAAAHAGLMAPDQATAGRTGGWHYPQTKRIPDSVQWRPSPAPTECNADG